MKLSISYLLKTYINYKKKIKKYPENFYYFFIINDYFFQDLSYFLFAVLRFLAKADLFLQFPGLPPATSATAIRNLTSFPSSFMQYARAVFPGSLTKARDKLNRESSALHRGFDTLNHSPQLYGGRTLRRRKKIPCTIKFKRGCRFLFTINSE
ncbi:hypothetical protein PUN28_000883 [Cardiocondyla obscurior]|uniref:Uncharacterized protein n=1 Tax=Cardiocondyla obscurior TaxID=286306 RepID=A0AAW2H208_9HYME